MAKDSDSDVGFALRPRARLLRTLGEELISSEVVAVIELVKNAYDADASRVMIRFTAPLETGKGRIEVIDNGHGMPLTTVRTVWMEPATPSKRSKIRRTEAFKRRFLGEKGIGRFASSRLADELEVISRPKNESREVYGLFDWRQFDDESKYLDQILILWETRKPAEILPGGTIDILWKDEAKLPPERVREQGTILRMSGLKQTWESKHFEDLRRALARLVSTKRASSSDSDKDPGFEVELSLPGEFAQFSSKIEPPPILKHPHYIISGSVEGDGTFKIGYKILAEGTEKNVKGHFVRVTNAKGQFEVRDLMATDTPPNDKPTNTRPVQCGPLNLEMRVWDRDELGNVVQKTHSTIQDIRRDLDSVAGVNIYRDGFRVLPYGEPEDDWLRLDLRRVQNPTLRLSNNQIYGVIQISADTNPSLKDQSNREGLDENQALEDLREILRSVLSRLEEMRYAARPRTKSKSKTAGGIFASIDLKPLSDYVAKQMPQDKTARELVTQAEQALDGQLKEIQTVLGRYQRLATLGQLIDHVLHEGRQPIASINNESQLGIGDTHGVERLEKGDITRISGRFSSIRKQGDILAIAFKRMEPFGGRRRGRPNQLYLEEIIKDSFHVFEGEIERLKVTTSLPKSQTLVRVDPAEMQEVFINLLQNSLYWLEQVPESKREIAVKVERKSQDQLEILFSDSGPGVPQENREMIFEPYFSTKPEGVGLGLSIVGEIITDYYGGDLQLLNRGLLKGANFQITLKKRV